MASPSFSPSAFFAGRCINHCRCVSLPLQRLPAPRLAARWGATRLAAAPLGTASGRPGVRCGALVQIGQNEFAAEVLGAELPVLVEFVADWCGPCRLISSIVEWASLQYKDRLKVVKIDHDANPELITEYKVYGLPTLILFRNGQEVPESRREGAITKVKLKEYLDIFLEPTSLHSEGAEDEKGSNQEVDEAIELATWNSSLTFNKEDLFDN